MLGKTNLLFVAGDETSEFVFAPEYILTSSGGSISKIEYINNLFFVFTSTNEVLYGSDVNSLQLIKKDGAAFEAKYIIYTNGEYYLADVNRTYEKAVIYKTTNFTSYEEVTLKTCENYAKVAGLFISSENKIAALIETRTRVSTSDTFCYDLLIVDSLSNYSVESATFEELFNIYGTTALDVSMKKDRIFAYNSNSKYIVTLNGTYTSIVSVYDWFVLDHFFYYGEKTAGCPLYYSLNGVDYIRLDFANVKNFFPLNIFEYDGSIAMVFSCEEGDKTIQKFTTSATPKGLTDAISSAIPVSIDYTMQHDSSLYKDGYSYLGCTGGIITKAKIDNAEVERPDVVVVKGFAAKEALKQANDYTDEKYISITKEVEQHEETTRQYMENAFATTPEGYAELVDTVSENNVKIDTIIENADLRIKADASGEEIYLTDSADGKAVEYALYGKAKQNTTSGKNLCEPRMATATIVGVTCTNNGDGTFSLSGKASSKATFRIDQSIASSLDNLKSYVGEYSISTITNKDTDLKVGLMEYTGSYIGLLDSVDKPTATINTESAFIYIACTGGVDYSGVTFAIQLEKNSSVTEYEPYTNGASPNPDYPQEIEVAGASYNLLENTATSQTINGVEFVVNEDKSVTVKGTATDHAYFVLAKQSLNIYDTSYILSGCPSGGSESTYRIVYNLTDENGEWKKTNADTGNGVALTNEYPKYRIEIHVAKNFSAENLVFKPMIRKASEKNDRYMPFGVGSVEVTSKGKNEYNPDLGTLSVRKSCTVTQENGLYTITSNADGLIYFNEVQNVGAEWTTTRTPLVSVNGNTNYTISLTNDIRVLALMEYDSSKKCIGSREVNAKKLSFTTKADTRYILCKIGLTNATNGTVYTTEIQLERGTVATQYQPYKETHSTIPTPNGLAGIKVSSGGNYTDSNGQQWICDEVVKYADGSGKHIQRLKYLNVKSFLGSHGNKDKNSILGYVALDGALTENDVVGNVMCNIANAVSGNYQWINNISSICINDSGKVVLNISNIASIDELTTYVNEHDVYVLYELETPITTPLTAEEISTFYPTTNISNDFDCGMSVKYNADSKNYIDKKIAEMFAAMNN